MMIHMLQHVPHEGPGVIADWASERGHRCRVLNVYANDPFPRPDELECLVVMGGPMGVYDTAQHPWLLAEKRFIEKAIADCKPVIGICLGAQLIADVLGARVHKAPEREIGWFTVYVNEPPDGGSLWKDISPVPVVFQWHGDTFDIPEGAARIARGDACENQAFVCGSAVGLQFHFETRKQDVIEWMRESAEELSVKGAYVQPAETLVADENKFEQSNRCMFRFLDSFMARAAASTDASSKSVEPPDTLDLRGVLCPMNFVKVKLQLSSLNVNDELDVLLDDGEPVQNVPRSLKEEGHRVLGLRESGDGHWILRVRKGS